MKKIITWIGNDAPLILYGLNAVIAAVDAFGFHASRGQISAVTAITQGLITIITAIAVRPVRIPVITGALTTLLLALAPFGLHLTGKQVGSAMPLLAIVLALLLRQHVSPLAKVRRAARPEHHGAGHR